VTSQRPIPFKVVCAIARKVLVARPHFTDCEWKEAVKVIAARQGWETPPPEMLVKALSAVERAVLPTMGQRPIPAPVQVAAPPGETGRELSAADARKALQNVKVQLQQRGLPTGAL
jgi:hypothetical protein